MNFEKVDEEGADVVSIKSLSRHFGEKLALDNISLNVKKGTVFGIVGENGAGKTTTIKHILGLYRCQSGSVSVFGKDPVADPQYVLSRIGYLSEEPDLPTWMTVKELLGYLSAFYPNWDMKYAHKLLDQFELPLNKRIGQFSKGQRARVGLTAAQAFHPELLLLDEPSSGLDPIVRRDILNALISTVVDEGGTVIFSSHLLDEVERFSDHLAMYSKGRVLLSEPMEKVKVNHHKISVSPVYINALKELDEYISHSGDSEVYCYGEIGRILHKIQAMDIHVESHDDMSLDEIFYARSMT